MQRLLILGASGLVGRALIQECKDVFDVYGTYFSQSLNISSVKQFRLGVDQEEEVKEILNKVKPDIVISCLRGDFEQQLHFHKTLALEIRNRNCTMYFFSTTNVFDGDFSKPHMESDTPIAESEYGKYKINCENMLTEILGERALIIRIPAIWGKNSPRWNSIIRSIQNNEKIEVYSNLVCNNLLDVQLAKQLRYIMEKGLKGIFHLGSSDVMTQAQFYERTISKLGSEQNILDYQLFFGREEMSYFCLKTIRDDIPTELGSTNDEIITYLLK
ncbi:MAG: sugar nucleotide-binding protein [Heyndrickxia sp.]